MCGYVDACADVRDACADVRIHVHTDSSSSLGCIHRARGWSTSVTFSPRCMGIQNTFLLPLD